MNAIHLNYYADRRVRVCVYVWIWVRQSLSHLITYDFTTIATNPTIRLRKRKLSKELTSANVRCPNTIFITCILYRWIDLRLDLNKRITCTVTKDKNPSHSFHLHTQSRLPFPQYCNDNFISFSLYLLRLVLAKRLQTLTLTKDITNILRFCFVSSIHFVGVCVWVCVYRSLSLACRARSLVFIAFFSLIYLANLSRYRSCFLPPANINTHTISIPLALYI